MHKISTNWNCMHFLRSLRHDWLCEAACAQCTNWQGWGVCIFAKVWIKHTVHFIVAYTLSLAHVLFSVTHTHSSIQHISVTSLTMRPCLCKKHVMWAHWSYPLYNYVVEYVWFVYFSGLLCYGASMTALLQRHCYISVTNDSALNEQWNWQCRKVFVTFDVTHCMHARAEVPIWYHFSLQVDPCIRLLVVESLYSIIKQLLTLDAHAPQGYSSWVCVQTVTNRPGRPKDRLI